MTPQVSRRNIPDHTHPQALDGLRRRLAKSQTERTQRHIEQAQAEGRWEDAEQLTMAFHAGRQAERQDKAQAARQHAARIAHIPLDQRGALDRAEGQGRR